MALAPIAPNRPITSVSNEGYETFTVTALSGTGATACYTAADANIRRLTKIKKLVINNTTAGGITITVQYYRASATTAYDWYGDLSLAANTQLVFNDIDWTLEPEDELRVIGNTGVNVFVTAREYQGNVKQ